MTTGSSWQFACLAFMLSAAGPTCWALAPRETIRITAPSAMFWKWDSHSDSLSFPVDVYVHNNRSTFDMNDRYKVLETVHVMRTHGQVRPISTSSYAGRFTELDDSEATPPFPPELGTFLLDKKTVSGQWQYGHTPVDVLFPVYRHSTVRLFFRPASTNIWTEVDAVDIIIEATVFANHAPDGNLHCRLQPTSLHLYTTGSPVNKGCRDCEEGPCAVAKPQPELQDGQASVNADLGTDELGRDSLMQVDLRTPDSVGFLSPHAIGGSGAALEYVKDGSGNITRLIGGKAVAEVIDPEPAVPGFGLKLYHSTAEADAGTGDFASLQFDFAANQVSISENYLGTPRSYQFRYEPATRLWSLQHEAEDKVLNPSVTGNPLSDDSFERLDTETTVAGEEVTKTRYAYSRTNGIARLQRKERDPGGQAVGIDYGYNADGLLAWEEPDDGPWKEYSYHSTNRLLIKQRTRFGSAPRTAADNAVHVLTIDHNPAGSPTRLDVETLLGQEVGRVYRVDRAGGYDEYVATVPGAVWSAATNLKTSHRFETEGEFFGKPSSVTRPDGTRTLYSYSRDPGSGAITTIEQTGEPHATDPAVIVDGVRTTTVTGEKGEVIAREVADIASGLTLSRELTISRDAFGRPTQTQTLAGLETRSYGCCRLESLTEVTGLMSTFAENGTVSSETRQGITHTTTRSGRTTVFSRRGTDGASVELARTEKNLAGDVFRWVDACGRETLRSQQIDPQTGCRTVTFTYPGGGTRVEGYFPDGRLQSVSGTAAYPERWEYGVEDNLRTTKVILPGSPGEETEWRKLYVDMAGRLVRQEVSHERGTPAVTQYFYNARGQLVRLVDPDGVTALFAYDGKGELVSQALDANGNGVIDLDGADRVTQWETTCAQRDGKTVRRVSRKEFQVAGNGATSTATVEEVAVDGLAQWTTTGGLTTCITTTLHGNGDSTVTEMYADGSRRVRQIVDGFVTAEARQDPAGATLRQSTYGYDAHGRLATSTDPRRGATRYGYYDDGQIQSVTLPDPGDGSGEQTTRCTYDPAGRLDTITLPDQGVIDRDYFPTGDLRRVSGARTWTAEYTYDSQGRMQTMTTAGGQTAWSYHPESGRLRQKTHGDGHGPRYSYTAAGRLSTLLNGRGTLTTFGYDALGDLVLVDYGDTTPDLSYTYTRHGRVATASQAGRTHSYTYAASGEWESESVSGGVLDGLLIDPTYDGLHRRSNVRAARPGWQVGAGYAYDALSRLQSIKWRNREVRYGYLPDADLLETTTFLTNGAPVLQTSRAWDKLGRLQSISHQGSAAAGPARLEQSFSYLTNAAGQRTRLTREDGGYWDFTHDTLGQLTSARERLPDGTPKAGRQFEYEADGIGFRTVARFGGDTAGQALAVRAYTPRAGDGTQIAEVSDPGRAIITGRANPSASVSIDGNPVLTRQGAWFRDELAMNNTTGAAESRVTVEAALNGNTESQERAAFAWPAKSVFEYDADGNLTFDGFFEYTWDARNRLTQVSTRNGLAPVGSKARDLRQVMEYDHLGRRIRRTLIHRVDGRDYPASDIAYVYDGWQLVAEVDARSSALLRSYIWGLDLSGTIGGAGGVGGLLNFSDLRSGRSHDAASDGNGNVAGLADALNGEQTAAYHYDPFGNLLGIEGAAAARNPFRFSSKYYDEGSGFYEYGLRTYDPRHGRWLSRDPAGEEGGVNLYGFVGNDPVGKVDPFGLQAEAPGQEFAALRLARRAESMFRDPRPSQKILAFNTLAMATHLYTKEQAKAAIRPDVRDPENCDRYTNLREMAYLAAAAYGGMTPARWKQIDSIDSKTGLDASVFQGRGGKVVIAFRGTTDTPDWKSNIAQGVGNIGKQYQEVADTLSDLAKHYPDAEVVGHSLGGGLAAAFGAAFRMKTVTFNPAGLHPNTQALLKIGSEDLDEHVTAHTLVGEILNTAQDVVSLAPDANGKRSSYLPAVSGNPVKLHKMEAVVATMERLVECSCPGR